MTQDDFRMSQNEGKGQRARGEGRGGEGQGGLFLSRFYSGKWLAFPVFGHKKGPSYILFKPDQQFNLT